MKLISKVNELFVMAFEAHEVLCVIQTLDWCKKLNADGDISTRIGVSAWAYDETVLKLQAFGHGNGVLHREDLSIVLSVVNDLINGYGVDVDKQVLACWHKLLVQIECLLP